MKSFIVKPRINRRSDAGATLILVLIIISVIGVVMAAVVGNADTNIRATVQLRDQSSDNYAADAATNAYLTELKNKKENCNAVSTSFGNRIGFYSPVRTQTGNVNASVTCTPDVDPNDGAVKQQFGIGPGIANNLPAYALLAMQTNNATEGIVFPQSNKTVCIENGSVASNSVIDINNNTFGVRVTGTGTASDCSTGNGAVVGPPASTLTIQAHGNGGTGGCIGTTGFKPTPCSALALPIPKPTVPAPTDPITRVNQPAVCLTQSGTTYAAFQPGLYTNVALLNAPCSGVDFEWFSPGTYYFDLGSTPWQWPTTLVGGTPTSGPSTINPDGSTFTPAIRSVDPATASTLAGVDPVTHRPTGLAAIAAFPNSCADPAAQTQYPGVQFVFGGNSTFTPSDGSALVCGTYSATAAPIAFYGLDSPVTLSSSGPGPGYTVPAQTLCGTVGAPTVCSGSASGRTLINPSPNGHEQFDFKGFVYAPVAPIVMNLKNSPGQFFSWGLVAWNFNLDVNGVSNTVPFIQLPKPNQGFQEIWTYAYQYVDVWTCPVSASACPQTGPPNVRVKIQYDGTGTPKVLSWSHSR